MIYTITISLLIEKPFYLLRPQSFSFQIVSRVYRYIYRYFMSQGWGFRPRFVPRGGGGLLYTMIVPGEGFLLPSSRVPGACPGRGLDEIDTCMSHRQRKSDMARPTSVDQVIHASLKCVEFFQLQSSNGSKPFLSVLVRLCASVHRQVGLLGKDRYCCKI